MCPFYSLTLQLHHVTTSTPLQVITTRAHEGRNTDPSKNRHMKLIQLHMYQGSFQSFTHWCTASTVIPLLPKATFTPSIQPNLSLPRTCPPLTSAINTLLAIQYSSILSTCPNHLNTLWLTPFQFQLSNAHLHSYLRSQEDYYILCAGNFLLFKTKQNQIIKNVNLVIIYKLVYKGWAVWLSLSFSFSL